MKLSVTCGNYNLALKFMEESVDSIEVGIKFFSCRFNNYLTVNEIEALLKKKSPTKIIVVINCLFFEQQIEELTNLIKKLVELKVFAIKFQDFAIPQIVHEQKLNVKLMYSPETLNVNYGQFDFFSENKIDYLDLSTELTLNEVKKMGLNKSNIKLQVKVHGLGFVMYSRWPMVSNFIKYSKHDKKEFETIQYLLIKEVTRKYPNIIYEDESGTHMMTGYFISGLKKIKTLSESGIDSIKIDSLFISDEDLINILKIYKNVMNNFKNLSSDLLDSEYIKISTFSHLPISEHFFDLLHGVKHTEKLEEE